MKVLLLGSGGREHAIADKLQKSTKLTTLYIAPGNPGTALLGTNVPISVSNHKDLLDFAIKQSIDLTIVGPEQPLVDGIVDLFRENGLAVFGPCKEAANLEGSKAWSKEIMHKYNVPTASYGIFKDLEESISHIKKNKTYPLVIKADGLAAGKGVGITQNESEAIQFVMNCFINNTFGKAGSTVVMESFLEGEEASVFALVDDQSYVILGAAQDHKAVFDGDTGPNTGGMGAYSPAPIVTPTVLKKVETQILQPLLAGLKKEGVTYQGILFIGLMIKDDTPSVVEFNVRFGDPETQVILPRLKEDLLDLFMQCVTHTLPTRAPEAHPYSTVCVVLCSGGYPGSYETGKAISGTQIAAQKKGIQVIHAGTKQSQGILKTDGGRVLGIVSTNSHLRQAIKHAYDAINDIHFDNMYFRRDIGKKGLEKEPV